ncbi:MAG: dTDP-4-dehydrorhamnose reductase [Patescibacteria group bacterium]
MSQKILIIGSQGMLGQELVRLFSGDDQYKVIGWDRNEIDITQGFRPGRTSLKDQVSSLMPNIIINAAAYNNVDQCENDEIEYQKAKLLNGQAPGNLAAIAKELGAIFVHYSTDYVFSGHKDKPEFMENDEPNPISNYGHSKLLGEQAVQESGDKYYIIRLARLFGRPAASENAKRSFFDTMLALGRKMAAENKELSVVDEEVSCFTYAPDLAQATKDIIEQSQPIGIYHVTNQEAVTWFTAAQTLFKLANIDVKLKPVSAHDFPRPAPRPKYSILKNTKLPALRGYQEALSEYLLSRQINN